MEMRSWVSMSLKPFPRAWAHHLSWDFFYAAAAGLLALWSSRLLVSGSYYSLWDLTWYGRLFPGPLPIILFLAVLASGGRTSIARAALLAAAVAPLLGDDSRLLSLAAAPAAAASLYALQGLGARAAIAIPSGLAVDHALHVAARGLEPAEFLWGRLALAVLAVLLAAAPQARVEPPGLGVVAGLALLQLGVAYPSGLLSMSRVYDYSLPVFALLGMTPTLAALLPLAFKGTRVSAASLAPTLLLAPAAGAVGGIPGYIASSLSAAGAAAIIQGSQPSTPSRAAAGGALFVALAVLGVGVYAYPYIGLWVVADRMEAVLLAAALVGLASTLKGAWQPPERVWPVFGLVAILAAVSLGLGLALQEPPIHAAEEGGGGVFVASLNTHQGFDAYGRFNGVETARLVASLVKEGYVVCMQEVDSGRLTSAYSNLPLALRSIGVDISFQPAIEGAYGVAIAGTRVEDGQGLLLPSIGEQRAALKASVGGVVVVTAHLGLDPGERETQAESLVEFALSPPRAEVICGDFNEEEGGALDYIGEYFELSLKDRLEGEGYTCCLNSSERIVIDYVGVARWAGSLAWARASMDHSDHLLVEGEVVLTRGG